ncbi:MAG TPA: EF-hand domain-containing protein [Xanthobacteraceae bacterium]|jgi:hypothetical protein|nr:EF-hand domain-containing protein [Xanthobacteraceae bacterium]
MSISSVGSGYTNPYQPLTFNSADTNADGALSLDEFSAIGKNVPGGNNGLSSQDAQSLFSAIDTNADGSISKTEAKTAFDKLSSAVQGQLLNLQEQSDSQTTPSTDGSTSQSGVKGAGHHGHHHGKHASASTTGDPTSSDPLLTAASSTDPTSTDPNATNSTSSDPFLSQVVGGASSLFMQAVSAYTNPVGTASDIVNQLLADLKAA